MVLVLIYNTVSNVAKDLQDYHKHLYFIICNMKALHLTLLNIKLIPLFGIMEGAYLTAIHDCCLLVLIE